MFFGCCLKNFNHPINNGSISTINVATKKFCITTQKIWLLPKICGNAQKNSIATWAMLNFFGYKTKHLKNFSCQIV
jgi:hypothetical protein